MRNIATISDIDLHAIQEDIKRNMGACWSKDTIDMIIYSLKATREAKRKELDLMNSIMNLTREESPMFGFRFATHDDIIDAMMAGKPLYGNNSHGNLGLNRHRPEVPIFDDMESNTDKFLVSVDNQGAPKYEHETIESAREEAERLCKVSPFAGKTVRILKQLEVFNVGLTISKTRDGKEYAKTVVHGKESTKGYKFKAMGSVCEGSETVKGYKNNKHGALGEGA